MKRPGRSVKLAVALLALRALACEAKGAARTEATELGVKGSPSASARAPVAPPPLPSASSSARSFPVVAPAARVIAGEPVTVFAVIGDFGVADAEETRVAELVRSEHPDFIITTGDNNYPSGAADTIDANIGRDYHDFIHPYVGHFGSGAAENRFFPSLGNHDWVTAGARPYLAYFRLPGNERYYDLVRGDVHLFAIDSDEHEPSGIESTSVQAQWVEKKVKASKAAWQVVYMHHPPYSSGSHGSSLALRWPYASWGADLVLAGHDHHYERLEQDGIAYIVNGLGGNHAYKIGTPIPASVAHYNDKHGAQIVEVSKTKLVSRFLSVDHELVDQLVLSKTSQQAP